MLYIMTPEVKRMELKYKRILLKLSGEALAGEKKTGLDYDPLIAHYYAFKKKSNRRSL